MPVVNSVVDLVGDQTPKDFNGGDFCLHFMVPVWTRNSLSFSLQRVAVKSTRCYYSIEELLSDTALIPLNSKGHDVKTLQKFLAVDSCRGFGVEMPEYGIVAHAGKSSPFDKPIAVVNDPNGTVRYYPSPIISNLIKRI